MNSESRGILLPPKAVRSLMPSSNHPHFCCPSWLPPRSVCLSLRHCWTYLHGTRLLHLFFTTET